jgi:hypothetical protein
MASFIRSPNALLLLLWLLILCKVADSSPSELPTDSILPKRQISPLCKTFPGDAAWPSVTDWDSLDFALNGALLKPTPISAVCHASWPQYDAEECLFLYNNWNNYDTIKR